MEEDYRKGNICAIGLVAVKVAENVEVCLRKDRLASKGERNLRQSSFHGRVEQGNEGLDQTCEENAAAYAREKGRKKSGGGAGKIDFTGSDFLSDPL